MTQSLIINSPYEVPLQHWQQARDGSLTLTPERRPAGYEIFDARHNTRRTETLDSGQQHSGACRCMAGGWLSWRDQRYPATAGALA